MWQFATTIAVAWGFRYCAIDALSVRYGDDATAFIEAIGAAVSVAWWRWSLPGASPVSFGGGAGRRAPASYN